MDLVMAKKHLRGSVDYQDNKPILLIKDISG